MDSTPPTADRQPCFGARLCAELKRLVVLAIVLGLMVVAGKYYCFDRLNEEIRARVRNDPAKSLPGLNVSVKSARRVAGQGVEIRGVRIAEAGGRLAPVLAEIDEIFADCDTRLPDFLTQPPQITALRIHRLKLRAERKPSGHWNLAHLLPLPPCQSDLRPRATISDASLEIIDPTQPAASGPSGLMLRNIELSVQPESQMRRPPHVLHVRGTLAGDHFDRVEIDGVLGSAYQPAGICAAPWKDWNSARACGPRCRASSPRRSAPLSSIRGRTYFGFHASRGPRSQSQPAVTPPPLRVRRSRQNLRGPHRRCPPARAADRRRSHHPLDNHGLSIDDLSARCGPTQLELERSLYRIPAALIRSTSS